MNCRHMIDDHHGRGVGEQPRWSERWTGFSARTGLIAARCNAADRSRFQCFGDRIEDSADVQQRIVD